MKHKIYTFISIIIIIVLLFCSCKAEINPDSIGFSTGKWDDNIYTNEWLSMKFELPEGWSYMDSSQLPFASDSTYYVGDDSGIENNGWIRYTTLDGFYVVSTSDYPNISLYFINNYNKSNRYDKLDENGDAVNGFLMAMKNETINLYGKDTAITDMEINLAGKDYKGISAKYYLDGNTCYTDYYAALKGDIIIVWAINSDDQSKWIADGVLQGYTKPL